MSLSIVITFPYTLGLPGGGPRDCCMTAKHLSKAGAKVTLITVTCHSPNRFPRPQTSELLLGEEEKAELEGAGVEVIRIPQHAAHYMLDGLSVKRELEKLLRERKIDIVLGWHQEVAFLPRYLKSKGILFGMISTMGNAEEWYNRSTGFRKAMRKMGVVRPLQQADVIFARSHFMRNLLAELFRIDASCVSVSYPGVVPIFSKVKRTVPKKISNFIYYGSFTTEKGIFETLDALGNIARKGYRDWRLRIAGWERIDYVKEVAWQNGIEDKMEFLGRLGHEQLVKELKWAHLAILPSHVESFGLAFAEAQASGIPVVGYEVGGVPEVVDNNKTGWLVPKQRIDLLEEAIIQAIENPEKSYQMGMAGRERITHHFTWQKTAEGIIERITELVNGGNSKPSSMKTSKTASVQ